MIALPESPEVAPDCLPVVDEFARRLPGLGLGALRLLLQTLQDRLGTAGEHPCDVERAQAVGHEINNRLTALQLERDLRLLTEGGASNSFLPSPNPDLP